MHRRPLLDMLLAYERLHPHEQRCAEQIRELVRNHPDCFERSCLPGHVTASAWIVSGDHARFLLTHHRRLGRWLQLGGHADGDSDVRAVALREAREESGMHAFDWPIRSSPAHRVRYAASPIEVLPLDIDVHEFPARGGEPAHFHHDVRFLLVARPRQELVVSAESNDLGWFEWDRIESDFPDESLSRMGRKARELLSV